MFPFTPSHFVTAIRILHYKRDVVAERLRRRTDSLSFLQSLNLSTEQVLSAYYAWLVLICMSQTISTFTQLFLFLLEYK